MASFLEDLWGSIFKEGPTPSLLIATNVTFAALELVLIALIFLTYSIHFVILFVLAGALWWAINWFVAELRLAKAEEEKTLRGRTDPRNTEPGIDPDAGGDEMSSGGDDTEVETDNGKPSHSHQKRVASLAASQAASSVASAAKAAQAATTSASARLGVPAQDEALRQRQRRSMAESTGSLSTDSEWEKVEGEQ